jgi:small-conductance mechanosensitive channel
VPDVPPMSRIVESTLAWLHANVLSPEAALQLAWVMAALAIGYALSRRPTRHLEQLPATGRVPAWAAPLVHGLCDVLFPAFSLALLLLYVPVAVRAGLPTALADAAASLGFAWIVIRAVSSVVRSPGPARAVAAVVWVGAALHITGLLQPLISALDAVGITVGTTRISVLTLATGLGVMALFLAGAVILARVIERQISAMTALSPSLRVLVSKVIHTLLVLFAVLIGLNAVGVDLTALTVLGGAIGLGLGFGLQKVISNFVSGIILLADRSIKPGDVIVVGETYGWVKHLSARYVSLITRDGKEHLVPNELLITERVENWSYSDNNVRIRVPIGISYNSDVRRALDLVLEAAQECPRALKSPRANCLVAGFGDSSVELELRVWINDPEEGVGNVKSDILLRVWDKFHENGIEIPFPQRDIHIKSGPPPARAGTAAGAGNVSAPEAGAP